MYTPKIGARKGQAPAITVPSTDTQLTYLNIPLVKYLREKGYERLAVDMPSSSEIKIRQAKEGDKSYKIIATGLRGFGISLKLSKMLPAGRYILQDKRRMVFVRA